jgi:hypothetical protein
MAEHCNTCKADIPHHFQAKGLALCLTCMAVKVNMGNQIKPSPQDRDREEKCILCQQAIPIGLPRSSLCEDCLHVIEVNNGFTYFHFYRNFSQPWVIKSGGIVLGPLSTAQVEEKLRNKEIGLFDLVQKPYGRWLYAREEKSFKTVVDEVRSRPTAHEDTVALTSTDITEVIEHARMQEEGTLAGARLVEGIEDTHTGRMPVERYGGETQPSNAFRAFIIFGFVLFVAAAIISALSLHGPGTSLSDDEYKRTLDEAKNAYYAGDYNLARTSFRKANGVRELETDSAILYLSVLIGQDLLAESEQILSKLSAKPLGQKEKTQLQILKGLKMLNSGDPNGAEDALKAALEADRKNEFAVFNLANVYLIKGDPDRAIDTLETVENPSNDPYLWKFIMADAAATRLDSKGIADDLARIIEKLGNPIHPSPYSAEINLILGYLNARAGNKVAATNISENILRSEPEVTEGSVENLWMFRRRVSWQNLEKYCSSLKDALAGSDVALSIWAFCQARGGDTAKAKDFSQELFLKKESDPLIRALYAYAELKVGKHDEAESLLKNQKLGTPFEHWVLARACQANKNNTCLESEVAKLIDVTPSSPFGLTEKIKSLMDKRDKKEISKWIEVAREKAWYYQPIRQLEMTQRSL